MNCHEVKQLAIAYLNKETSASERALIQSHLAGCEVCRGDIESLSTFQRRLSQTLQRSAARAEPSPQAWRELKARLERAERRPAEPDLRSWLQRFAVYRRALSLPRKTAFAATVLIVLAFSVVAFVPSVRAEVRDVIRRIRLGEYSTIEQQISEGFEQPGRLPADMWIVDTGIGGWSGSAPKGMDPVVRSTTSLEEAQASVDFPIRTPVELPEGYSLREVKLPPGSSPVFLFYSGPEREIVLIETHVGLRPGSPGSVTVNTAAGVVINGTLEEVEFDGHQAAWVEGHSLVWEAGGMSYTVGGLDLSLEEAKAIARSVK